MATHYVMCYGSLKKGFHNHNIVENCRYIDSTITEDLYDMFSCGEFPAAIDTLHNYYVYGEIYEVDDMTLDILDYLESNGSLYQRKLVNVVGHNFQVWMYFLIDSDSFTSYSSKDIVRIHGVVRWGEDI